MEGRQDPSVGTITGLVFGGVFLVILVLCLVVFKKRRKRNRPTVLPVIEPFNLASNPQTATTGNSHANSPAALVRQLHHVLDAVLSLRPASDRPTSGPASSGPASGSMDTPVVSDSHYATPPPVYSTPPPGYRQGRSTSKA